MKRSDWYVIKFPGKHTRSEELQKVQLEPQTKFGRRGSFKTITNINFLMTRIRTFHILLKHWGYIILGQKLKIDMIFKVYLLLNVPKKLPVTF